MAKDRQADNKKAKKQKSNKQETLSQDNQAFNAKKQQGESNINRNDLA